MKKIKWIVAVTLLAVLILGGCKPKATPEPTPTAAPTMTPVPTAAPTVESGTPAADEAGYCEASPLPEFPATGLPITIAADDWSTGASAADAELTIIEYSDFQCPACASTTPYIDSIVKTTPGIRLIYRHLPLESLHDKAFLAGEAAEAAGAQGKFWEMHTALFDHAIQGYIAMQNGQTTTEWIAASLEDAPAEFAKIAQEIGLDVARFTDDLQKGTYRAKVDADFQEFGSLGLDYATPTFIIGINGVYFKPNISSYDELVYYLAVAKMRKDNFTFFDTTPEMTVTENQTYQATLQTTQGDIVLEVSAALAPIHVNSFVFLAQQQWYNDSDFFYVRDNFVALTGDPSNTTYGYPGYYCDGEKQSTFDTVGTVGILPNGQFFITLGADASQLNGQFTQIGRVVEGMDVLDKLARAMPRDPTAPTPDKLKSIEIVKK
ncbi:MAG TPA: peptidylprolyl isomerase [Anaerolineae bacterium]|nr:peptidylprolyl isomerase [Anaerolineae bacterium]HQI87377.1 peptidylprolyl isomerase [Anaerolineae bacterium]